MPVFTSELTTAAILAAPILAIPILAISIPGVNKELHAIAFPPKPLLVHYLIRNKGVSAAIVKYRAVIPILLVGQK